MRVVYSKNMKNEERKVVRPSDVGGELVARRHNELIVAKHRLSMQAQRMFLYVVSMIDETHDEKTEYEFSVSDLANVIGIDRSRLYKSMVEVVEEVAGCMVDIPALDAAGKPIANTIVRIGLIKNRQRVRFTGSGDARLAGSISVSLYKELLPYVRELKARFTEVELKYAFRLPSAYSLRIYDLLKVRSFKGQPWRVHREELRSLLGIGKDEYLLWGDFRRFVLEKAQSDISTHTDLAFDLEYVKTGNTVTELVFHLRKEGGSEVEVLPGTDKHKAFKAMLDLGLDAKAADNVLKAWWDSDPDLIRWHLAEVKRLKGLGKVSKPIGWFLAGLKKDFRPQRKLFEDMRQKAEAVRSAYASRVEGEPEGSLKKSLDELYNRFDVDSIQH